MDRAGQGDAPEAGQGTRLAAEHPSREEQDGLRASEERLRLALDVAQLGTWTWDLATGAGQLDERAAEIVGLPPGDVANVAEAQRASIHPEDLARIEEAAAAGVAGGGAFDLAYRVIRPDGCIRHVASRARALHDEAGRPVRLVGTNRDVTADREADARLRASETRYRTLADNLCDYAIFLLDPDGIITEWTAGAEHVNGFAPAEVIGRHFTFFYTPDEVAAGVPEQELAEAAATGRAEREGWRVRKGGERFWANEIATAVRDGDGRIVGFTKISRDLTERRAAEAAAQRDTLRRHLAHAEEEERRRLARELHDEAGQHLTALALGLKALADVAPAGSEVDRRTEKLRALANTLGRDLHAVAVRLRPRALDDFGLEAALAAYVEEWSRQSGIEVSVHARVAADRLPVAIEGPLYRIVQEALTNVAQHSEAARASVVVEQRDGHIVAIIEDNGRGFDPEHLGSASRAVPGLGLLGMRERVTLLGGTVEVESTAGNGTTIFVRIPIEIPALPVFAIPGAFAGLTASAEERDG